MDTDHLITSLEEYLSVREKCETAADTAAKFKQKFAVCGRTIVGILREDFGCGKGTRNFLVSIDGQSYCLRYVFGWDIELWPMESLNDDFFSMVEHEGKLYCIGCFIDSGGDLGKVNKYLNDVPLNQKCCVCSKERSGYLNETQETAN